MQKRVENTCGLCTNSTSLIDKSIFKIVGKHTRKANRRQIPSLTQPNQLNQLKTPIKSKQNPKRANVSMQTTNHNENPTRSTSDSILKIVLERITENRNGDRGGKEAKMEWECKKVKVAIRRSQIAGDAETYLAFVREGNKA